MMKILNKEDEKDYSDFIDNIAITLFKETCKNIKRLNEQDPNVKMEDVHEEIGAATGQVVLDRLIELTKDMDRDQMIRFFGESVLAMLVPLLNTNSAFMARIQLLSVFTK